ncbi:UNVERIFIED_CONTAM: hypothetical protein Sradi_3883100 [Sesamum radiatum]|uniref:Uncharacterized protein n=1 Tax=Sesamum radiatum TaxID=300843 RepID=A0AAW2PDT0_SESRA
MAALLPHLHLSPNPSCCRTINPRRRVGISIQCSDDSSPPNRGFGPKSRNKNLKSSPKQSSNQAPGLSSPTGGRMNYTSSDDLEFEQRLQAVRKLALEQKKAEEQKEYGAIDYDAPTETNSNTIGLGTKIGVGVAVVAFGLVFAFGDFLPSGSVSPTQEDATVAIPEEVRAVLEKRLKQFEETLRMSPEDSTALEGAAVTLAEMREYKRAATLLEKLTEKKPSDPDAFRLLGEVKYELKDYEGSVVAYRSAERASNSVDFEILRGLTNSLLAAKRPDEAVQVLLASRERLNKEKSKRDDDGLSAQKKRDLMWIPFRYSILLSSFKVDLLLGKAYSDWGHISDAVSVYDQLISSHPDDFRGYLAKVLVLFLLHASNSG